MILIASLFLLLLGVSIQAVFYGGIISLIVLLVGLIFGLTINWSVVFTVIAIIAVLHFIIYSIYVAIMYFANKKVKKEMEDIFKK